MQMHYTFCLTQSELIRRYAIMELLHKSYHDCFKVFRMKLIRLILNWEVPWIGYGAYLSGIDWTLLNLMTLKGDNLIPWLMFFEYEYGLLDLPNVLHWAAQMEQVFDWKTGFRRFNLVYCIRKDVLLISSSNGW